MVKRRFTSSLFLVSNGQLQRVSKAPAPDIYVGIWWHASDRIVAFLEPSTSLDSSRLQIDSNLSHDALWGVARKLLDCGHPSEYFDVPRGRVLWDAGRLAGVIYHGNASGGLVLKEIAKLFRHPRWETHVDEHYLTGEDLNSYFGLD